MKLTTEQLHQYKQQGMLFIGEYFSEREVEIMRAEVALLSGRDSPGRVLEKDGKSVRAIHGSHASSEVFRRLTLHPRLIQPVQQMLASPVYVYQFKINMKLAFDGDVWPWHQDFIFWHEEDGMSLPRVVNAAIFLEEANEFNGPMYVIPGSHKEGMIDVRARADNNTWVANFSADLKYTLDRSIVKRLAERDGIVAPKGPAGSVLFFDGNLAHGSPPNISPFSRTIVFVTYNSVDNIPVPRGNPRPEFLVGRDHAPLKALDDDILLQPNRQN